MKIRRADKRYPPRHGGTWVDDLQLRAGEIGTALGWLAAAAVVGVTGYFLHDDLFETVRELTGDTSAGIAAAGWGIVVVSAGASTGFLAIALRDRLHRALLLACYAAGAVAAFPALWYIPTRDSGERLGHDSLDLVAGTRWGWITIVLSGFLVMLSALAQTALRVGELWQRRWLLGTAAAIVTGAALTLIAAITLAG
ncbi:hypothetical protein OHA21_42870 [Actinoplanes sp. NBC_00393]|uniref:hypothetical protein n=1 Tax=Actinoplanes sp. NBC_00393 TaxID=2975953 RepID=UPI002E22F1E0